MARKDPKRDREDVLALIPFWAKSVVKTSTTETLVPLMLKNSPNRKYDSRYSDHIPIVEIKRRKKLIRRKIVTFPTDEHISFGTPEEYIAAEKEEKRLQKLIK